MSNINNIKIMNRKEFTYSDILDYANKTLSENQLQIYQIINATQTDNLHKNDTVQLQIDDLNNMTIANCVIDRVVCDLS